MQGYAFETTPYDHQRKVFEESWAAEHFAFFMEMGTGKSKVAIDTMAALYESGKIKAALVIAPKGVYDNWVKGEIPIHLPKRISRRVHAAWMLRRLFFTKTPRTWRLSMSLRQ